MTEENLILKSAKAVMFLRIELNKSAKTACISWYEYSSQLQQNMFHAFFLYIN